MKSKTFWGTDLRDPFSLTRRFQRGLSKAWSRLGKRSFEPGSVQYLWIHLAEHSSASGSCCEEKLTLDGWLNLVDEAAASGAEWVVLYVGAGFAGLPWVWELAEWAQKSHGLRVAFHVECGELAPDEIERLNDLDPSLTVLFGGLETLRQLKELATLRVSTIQVDVSELKRESICRAPESMVCVDAGGTLYSCGLVLGDQEFVLGDARDRSLVDVVEDSNLPHHVSQDGRSVHGCSGCPGLFSGVAREKLSSQRSR